MNYRRAQIRKKVVEILRVWDALQKIPILNGKRYPIPRGETRKAIPWSRLLNSKTFRLGDRGFWLYTYHIRYLGADGLE